MKILVVISVHSSFFFFFFFFYHPFIYLFFISYPDFRSRVRKTNVIYVIPQFLNNNLLVLLLDNISIMIVSNLLLDIIN